MEGHRLGWVIIKVAAVHADHHRRVGVFAVAGMQAHAVGDHSVFLAGGGTNRTAGAHAEGVHAPPAADMLAELVLAHRQHRVAGSGVVEALVNFGLQVFGPEAHRERLALQRQA